MAVDHDQDSYFQQQTSAPPDLHDLVTTHLDTADAESFHPSSTSLWHPQLSPVARPERPSLSGQHRSSSGSGLTMNPTCLSSTRRRSLPYIDAPQTQIQTAEKAGDNPNSVSRRFSFEPEPAVSTPTRLNRLFAGPPSPPSSRETSYRKSKDAKTYVRSMSSDTASLNSHLYTRGLLGGKHSDITVNVFGHAFALHRIILDRAPFFASALSEPWLEASSREISLHPDDIDPSITKVTFELALRRLYGCHTQAEEELEARGLFATGCWLEMQDLIDASTTAILRQMQTKTLGRTVQLVTNYYYGKPGEKILASAKAMLCRDGWSMPMSYWDSIPSDVIRELVGGDSLFIPGEWERWVLARRILDRKLRPLAIEAGLLTPNCTEAPKSLQMSAQRPRSTHTKGSDDGQTEMSTESSKLGDWYGLYAHADIEPLLELLDDGIYYMHLGFEHLQLIRGARDCLGVPLLPEDIISNALWKSLELRQNILNAHDAEEELGLAFSLPAVDSPEAEEAPAVEQEEAQARKFWIPSADCNIVVGGSGDPVVTASNGGAQRSGPERRKTVRHADAVQWFSDFMKERSQASSASTPDLRPASYSTFPPFRFAADFPSPRTLKEKKRVYSQTVFYAGSYWNVYIQKVRTGTKNPQLGVYLHRARDGESLADNIDNAGPTSMLSASGIGTRGSVDDRIGVLEREMLLRSERRTRRHIDRHLSGTTIYSSAAGHDLGADEDGSAGSSPDAELIGATQPGASAATAIPYSASTPARIEPYTFIASPGIDSSSSSPEPSHRHHLSPSQLQPQPQSQSQPHTSHSSRRLALRRHQQQHSPAHSVPALPPYADSRPTIRTYFKIYSPSKGGRMLSVYESAPDSFSFSQSWGWKSSTLMVDDAGLSAASQASAGAGLGLAVGHRGGAIGGGGGGTSGVAVEDDDGEMREGREFGGEDDYGDEERDRIPRADCKLRFMVVLGVV